MKIFGYQFGHKINLGWIKTNTLVLLINFNYFKVFYVLIILLNIISHLLK